MKKFSVLALFSLFCLSGCANSALFLNKKDNAPKIDLKNNGVAALAILKNHDESEMTLHLFNLDDQKAYTLSLDPFNKIYFMIGPAKTPDIRLDEDKSVHFYYYQLPQGKYQIVSVSIEKYILTRKAESTVTVEDCYFTVNNSEITYIGSYDINVKRNLFGVEKAGFEVTDEYSALVSEYKKLPFGDLNTLSSKKELVTITSR